MFKNAPYRYTDFESLQIQYGTPDSMLNSYDSKTQNYQYLTNEDSLVKKKLKLTDNDLLYLHRKAMELGFWNVDDDMTTLRADSLAGKHVPRFVLTYNSKEKQKKVVLDADFEGNPKMKGAAKTTIDEVLRMINDANVR